MTINPKIDTSQLIAELEKLKNENSTLRETQKLFSNGPVVIFKWLCDGEEWPVEFVSLNVSDVFGWSANDFYINNIKYSDIISKLDIKRVTKEVEQAIKQGIEKFDHEPYRILNKNGSVHWLHDHTVIVRDTNGTVSHFYGYVFDITEQKILENKLSKFHEHEFIDGLIDTAQEIILVLDLEGKILQVNSFFEKLTGYSIDDAKEEYDILEFLYEIDRKEASKLFQKMLHGKIITNKVYPLVNKYNNNIQIEWFGKGIQDSKGNIASLLVIGHDVSEKLFAEEVLRDSRTRYRTLFEKSPVPLWEEDFTELFLYIDKIKEKGCTDFRLLFDNNLEELNICAQKIKIIDVNQATLNLYCTENKEELLGELNKIILDTSLDIFKEEIIAFANGKTDFKSEAEIKTVTGKKKTILLEIKIDKTPSGATRALCATPDITAQKQAKKDIQKHQNVLSAVAEISNNFLQTKDWSEKINQALLLIGQAADTSRSYLFEHHTGPNGESLYSQRFEWCAENVTPQIDNIILQNFNWDTMNLSHWHKKLASGEVVIWRQSECSKTESELIASQGIYSLLNVPLFLDGTYWGFVGFDDCKYERHWTNTEITALKMAANILSSALQREHFEQALHESELRFRGLVETTNDWIWEVSAKGFFVYVSPSVKNILGYLPEELIGKSIFDYVPDNQSDILRQEYSDIINKGGIFAGVEITGLHKDGYLVNLESSGVIIYDKEGKPVGSRGVNRDISSRKQIEKVRLLRAEKQKNQLIREVHHQIKNHLQGLMGLLKQHQLKDSSYDSMIDEAIHQIESIAIVYGLQAAQPGAQLYFDQMLEAITFSARGLTTLPIIDTHGDLSGSCEIDREKAVALALVVNELIINAIKHYSDHRNCREIIIHHEFQSAEICLKISNPGKLGSDFDFNNNKGLGMGLELIKAMLPNKGARLSINEEHGIVEAKLLITPPLLIK